jgi:uncharacterized protein (DUF1501 family)
MAENSLTRMAEQSTNDRVFIILQMHGGNDGLNSIIPVEAYDLILPVARQHCHPRKK